MCSLCIYQCPHFGCANSPLPPHTICGHSFVLVQKNTFFKPFPFALKILYGADSLTVFPLINLLHFATTSTKMLPFWENWDFLNRENFVWTCFSPHNVSRTCNAYSLCFHPGQPLFCITNTSLASNKLSQISFPSFGVCQENTTLTRRSDDDICLAHHLLKFHHSEAIHAVDEIQYG